MPPTPSSRPSPSPAAAKSASRTPTAGAPPTPSASFVVPRDTLASGGPGGLDKLLNTEWLLSNGLGGFAMGTCAGVPARRYHAMLIAAASPPGGRIVALNAMVETLDVLSGLSPEAAASHDLCTFRFGGHPPVQHPAGASRLKSFTQELAAAWTYQVRESGVLVEVVKELRLADRANAAQLRYTVRRLGGDGAHPLRLRLRPLTSLRDFHGLIRRSWADRFAVTASSSEAHVRFDGQPTELHLRAEGATFAQDPQWWDNFFYQMDAERGQDCIEDLYSPGQFVLQLAPGQQEARCTVQASIAPMAMFDADASTRSRASRLAAMHAAALANRAQKAAPPSPADASALASLVAAADAFVVARRAPGGNAGDLTQTSIIAGYPWFADWGRDTSISLPGLLLCTGRLDDAKRTLLAFASHRRNGIVPNVFSDQTGEPEYNTVDASLWFILGACAYRTAGGDRATWDGLLAPACLDIVTHYRRGTDFNIAMDPQDKLITAGTNATQLTWMDAKRDGVTFTPRHGKAVEINALWHAALRELAGAMHDADSILGANLNDLAGVVGASFRAAFWNPRIGCLYDTLTPADGAPGWVPQPDVRPNQIFAVSLPHSPLSAEQQRSVLACVRERLLTPYGLRTLDPADPRYLGRYEGDLFQRDRAYHNGTAWPWLLGPYAEAVLRVGAFSPAARNEARAALQSILTEMHGVPTRSGPCGCIGQIAEIYDGSAPQRPQGCPAQAWSIAEALRVMCMIV